MNVIDKLSTGQIKGFTYAVGEFNHSNLQVFDVRFLERVLQHAKLSEKMSAEKIVEVAVGICGSKPDLLQDLMPNTTG